MPNSFPHKFRFSGFTFLEVIITLLIVSMLVFMVQMSVLRFMRVEKVSEEEAEFARALSTLSTYVRSPVGFQKYILSRSEQKLIAKKGNLGDTILKERFPKNQKLVVFDRPIRLGSKIYRLKVERETLQSVPFLFGIEFSLSRASTLKKSRPRTVRFLLSYYDVFP